MAARKLDNNLKSYRNFLLITLLGGMFLPLTLKGNQNPINQLAFLLVAKDIPWWKDPSAASADEHRQMQQCQAEHYAYEQTLKRLG